jgi:hypothetical protein
MFRKLAAAAIAVSLIAGPALAQGTTIVPATTSQKAAVKTDGKVQKAELIVTKTKKHVAMHRHHRKHFAHVKHVKHMKFVKHVKHLKQVKQPAKYKIAG